MPKPKTTTKAPPVETELPTPPKHVEFTYGDITVTVPQDADDWSTKAELARLKFAGSRSLDDGLSFIEVVLGPEQWAQVVGSLKRGEFYEFTRGFSETINKECSI